MKIDHIVTDIDRDGRGIFNDAEAEGFVEGQHGVSVCHWESYMIETTYAPNLLG